MEELKLLIGMVADLPSMALWVLIGFLLYKLAVIGSIYGVIKLFIDKTHDWLITRKTQPTQVREIQLQDVFNGITITSDDTMKKLLVQIRRLAGKNVRLGSDYIHSCSVQWLREAIDEKERSEIKNESLRAD